MTKENKNGLVTDRLVAETTNKNPVLYTRTNRLGK